MGASTPDPRRIRRAGVLVSALLLLLSVGGAAGQVEAHPTLGGTVFLADTAMGQGTVVLHHVSEGTQGQLDSARLGPGGRFSFALPGAPDPRRGDIYFASVRHDGVLYFGPAITVAAELDSLYEIHAYDTLVAPGEGADVVLQSRSLFFEPNEDGSWRATDLFELRNERLGTFVANREGLTWTYPLPPGARDVMAGEGEMSLNAVSFEDGALAVRAALPPGERIFVVRYTLDSPFTLIPTPGTTEALDILVAEPAPSMEIDGLELMGRIELSEGETFLRFTAAPHAAASIVPVELERQGPPPVEWIAVILALVLALGGLVAFRSRWPTPAAAVAHAGGRQALLLEVAKLDEEFEARPSPSEKQREAYERTRAQLLDRIRSAQ